MGTTQICYWLFWTNPGSNTPQNSSCIAIYLLSKKNTEVRQAKYTWHYKRRKYKLISNILLWTFIHGCASVGQPARTYSYQVYMDTGCSLEDLPGAMDDRNRWRESGKYVLSAQLDDDSWYYYAHLCILLVFLCWLLYLFTLSFFFFFLSLLGYFIILNSSLLFFLLLKIPLSRLSLLIVIINLQMLGNFFHVLLATWGIYYYFCSMQVFHTNSNWWFFIGQSDSKSPLVSRTLWIILADLSSTVIQMISVLALITSSTNLSYYYYYYYNNTSCEFFTSILTRQQVSSTHPFILTDFDCAMVCMVLILPLIPSSPILFARPLRTIPWPPATIGITITFRHLFSSRYLSIFSLFLLFSIGKAKSKKFLINTSSGLLAGIGWFVCISKYQKICYFYSRWIFYTNLTAGFSLKSN